MIYYDYNQPYYFKGNTKTDTKMVKFIYFSLLLHIFIMALDLVDAKKTEGNLEIEKEICSTIYIPVYLFLFFIMDEVERIFLTYFSFLIVNYLKKSIS